jgi:hypothetical protein
MMKNLFRRSIKFIRSTNLKIVGKDNSVIRFLLTKNTEACIFVSKNDPKLDSIAGQLDMSVSSGGSNFERPAHKPGPPSYKPGPSSSIPVGVTESIGFHLPSSTSKYRIGKTLGSGTRAVVKEAIHIETGKYFACKIIHKRLMEGREHMVSPFF